MTINGLAGLSDAQRDVANYVRQLLGTNRVTQPLFDRLRAQLGVSGLVDLTALIGHYGIVAGILNAFEVAPRADAEHFPLPEAGALSPLDHREVPGLDACRNGPQIQQSALDRAVVDLLAGGSLLGRHVAQARPVVRLLLDRR